MKRLTPALLGVALVFAAGSAGAGPAPADDPPEAAKLEQATVQVNPRQVVDRIDSRLSGVHVPAWNEIAFTDGGIDPRLQRNLERSGSSFLVFPGGAFGLDWVWNDPNSENEMTTEQFLQIVDSLDATAKISVNPNESPTLAADWIRHVNGKLGADVRYWEVVDEPYLHMSADDFIATMREFVPVMKQADPSIKIVTNISAVNPDWSHQVIEAVGDLTDVWSIHFLPLPPSQAINPSSPYSPDDKEAFYADLLNTPDDMAAQFADVRGWVDERHPGGTYEYHLGSWAPVWSGPEDWTVNALPAGLWAADMYGTMATAGVDAAASWAMMNPYPPGRGDYGLFSPEMKPYVIGEAAALWANHFGENLIESSSSTDELSTYASLSKDRRTMYVLLVNKRRDADLAVDFDLGRFRPRGDAAAWLLDGAVEPNHLSDYGLRRQLLDDVSGEFTWTVPSYSAVALEIPVAGSQAELAPAPNLAIDQRAYASSEAFATEDVDWQTDDYLAGRAVDGDDSTRWASAIFVDDPEWLAVDLGQSQPFDRIELNWEYWAADYTVEVSDDGENWRAVADATDAVRLEPEPQPVEQIVLDEPVTAQHVRISATERPAASGVKAGSSTWTPQAFSLWEVGVYLDS